MMTEIVAELKRLQDSLEGATVLNVFLLNKLGGQLTIEKAELVRVCQDFSKVAYSAENDRITIKLCSTGNEMVGKEGYGN
jgi:hypothetical protein